MMSLMSEQSKARPGPAWWIKILASIALPFAAALTLALEGPAPLFEPWPRLAGGFIALAGLGHVAHGLLLRRGRGDGLPRLVTEGGLYRLIRHPMYLFDALMALGFLAMSGDAVAAALAAAVCLAVLPLSLREDRELAREFGAAFEDWSAATRRLIPWVF